VAKFLFKKMIHNLAPTPIQPECYKRIRGCEQKKRYDDASKAQRAIESIKRNGTDKRPHRQLNHYKCEYCFGFHVGHLPDLTRRKTDAQMLSEISV
jgi:hypothetical protein